MRFRKEVLNLFVESPFWTVGKLGKTLGVAYTTARRAVDRLEEAGIVSASGQSRRIRVYCARAVLATLDAPLQLEDPSGGGVHAGSQDEL